LKKEGNSFIIENVWDGDEIYKGSMFDFEGTPFSNFRLPASWFGEDVLAVVAGNH
jgi:hypothetical protein